MKWILNIEYKIYCSFPAEVVVHPEAVTEFKGGSTVLLTCAASGLPLPSLSWTQHSTELNNGSRFIIHQRLVTEAGISFITSILEVCSANASTYNCSADHHNGGDFFTSVIEIQAEGKVQHVVVCSRIHKLNILCSILQNV